MTEPKPRSQTGETFHNWPHVVAVSRDGNWRIVISNDTPPAMQWILQRHAGAAWSNNKFCQTRIGLEIYASFDPVLKAAVADLPDWCPQLKLSEPQVAPAGDHLPADAKTGSDGLEVPLARDES
jgi:hypothetical protein